MKWAPVVDGKTIEQQVAVGGSRAARRNARVP